MKQNEDAAPSILDDVWRDAMRYRFVRVADGVRISHEAARSIYAGALALVTEYANGRHSAYSHALAARLEAVQESNRMAKRRG